VGFASSTVTRYGEPDELWKETAVPVPDGTVPVLQLPELFQFPFVEFHWWVWLRTAGI
jgi:hypothetical protein